MEDQAFLNSEPKTEEYPKYVDFNVEEMKREQIKYLGLLLVVGILLFLLGFLPIDGYYLRIRLFGGATIISILIMFVMLVINSKRAVRTVVIEQDKFTVNSDVFVLDSSTEVKIAPRFGYAGKADNIYLTVTNRAGTHKYWVGIVSDVNAGGARSRLQNELVRLDPTLVK